MAPIQLFVRDRNGDCWQPKESIFGVEYWMRIKLKDILDCFERDWEKLEK